MIVRPTIFSALTSTGRKLQLPLGLPFWYYQFMAKSNKVLPKRGRPATGRDPVTAIRLSSELRATIDNWARAQDDKPPRSEAIRRLVELGLKAKGPKRKRPKKKAPSVPQPGILRARGIQTD
jgi:hypothetical protein